MIIGDVNSCIGNLSLRPILIERIKERQNEDPYLLDVKNEITLGRKPNFNLSSDNVLHFGGQLCVPAIYELKHEILEKARSTLYSIFLGNAKLYHDLQALYW